jgi:4-amino-4-deoxy-L-arabinose transferase-like glycosyltransferase
VVLPSALGDPRISVFDEPTHADWVARMLDGELVARGDTITPEVLAEWSCRGWALDSSLPPCDGVPHDASEYTSKGLNYNHFHAPGYYALTALGAGVVGWVAPATDVVTAARVVGVGWAVLGMVGVYAVARELGARVSVARAAGLLVVGTPLVVHLLSVVNNDAALIAAGALIIWVGLRAVRTGVPWWWAAGAGAAAGLIKVVALPVVLTAVILTIAVAWLWCRPGDRRRRLVGSALLMAAGFAVVSVAWFGVQSLRAPDAPFVDPVPGDVKGAGVPWAIVGVVFDTLPPTAGPPAATTRAAMQASDEIVRLVLRTGRLVDLVLAAVPIALVFAGAGPAVARRRRVFEGGGQQGDGDSDDPWWVGVPLGVAMVCGLAIGAVALNVQHWLAKGSALSSLHPRYGLALLAAFLGGLAMLADRYRGTRVALWALVIAGLTASVVASL